MINKDKNNNNHNTLYNHYYSIILKPKGQKQLRQLLWRIFSAENQILKYIQIFAAGINQADWEILSFAKNQAGLRNLCFC